MANTPDPIIESSDNLAIWNILNQILSAVGGGGGGSNSVVSTNPGVGSASVAAGKYTVAALFSNDFTGSFNGAARQAGSFISITASPGKTLPLIPYVVTTGSITLDVIG